MKKDLILLVIFFCTVSGVSGQTRSIEHLKTEIATSPTRQERLNALLLLIDHRQSLRTDALRQYAFEAKQLSQKVADPLKKAMADYFLATYYVTIGQLDSAVRLCEKNLGKVTLSSFEGRNIQLRFSALKAQILVKNNQYTDAIHTFYKTLSAAERSNDTLNQVVAKNGIGWVNMEMGHYPEALRWFFAALKTTANPQVHQRQANIYSNIAAVYTATNQFDSADKYVRRSIEYARASENLFFLSNSYNILADNYIRQNKPALAKEPLQQAARIREQIGDPFYIVSDLSQLALFYAEQGQPQDGIAISHKGIDIARRYGLVSKLPFLLSALAKSYKAAGEYKLYGETVEKVMALKDSVYQQNSAKELAKIRTSYQQQKQRNLIIQQELAISKRNTLLYSGAVVALFGLAIIFILFTSYKRRQKLALERLREEEKYKVEQAVMVAKEAERRRISADLHDNLGAYATAISSNIDEFLYRNGTGNEASISLIKSNAEGILNSLNETIWVLNKTEIYLTNLSDRFKSYASRIGDSYADILVNISETIEHNVRLSPEAALNMLRIMQEAFHNAIRHSGGTCITVEIYGGPRVEVSIADNGIGFTAPVAGGGHGMANMRKRARDQGWELLVESKKEKGTVLRLRT